MRVPTPAGQYRRVQYTDDGCTQYQCLWCMNHIEIRDDPQFWCFCPKCAKSWFTRLECRDRGYPRWAYNRWGNDCPSGVNLWPPHKQPEWEWIIEERNKWPDCLWGDWTYETSYTVQYGELGAWREAAWRLNNCRRDEDDEIGIGIKFEYRVIKRKIR